MLRHSYLLLILHQHSRHLRTFFFHLVRNRPDQFLSFNFRDFSFKLRASLRKIVTKIGTIAVAICTKISTIVEKSRNELARNVLGVLCCANSIYCFLIKKERFQNNRTAMPISTIMSVPVFMPSCADISCNCPWYRN